MRRSLSVYAQAEYGESGSQKLYHRRDGALAERISDRRLAAGCCGRGGRFGLGSGATGFEKRLSGMYFVRRDLGIWRQNAQGKSAGQRNELPVSGCGQGLFRKKCDFHRSF